MERAEEAILEEIRASGGQKAEDPFTRRSTKPTMIHRPKDAIDVPAALISKPKESQPTTSEPVKAEVKDASAKTLVAKPKTSDLFSAHDFDIKIDLEVPLPCKY